MKRGGVFQRPVLRFKDGTALTPAEGFDMGFKPFRGPGDISIGLLHYREVEEDANELYQNLFEGVGKFSGLGSVFNCYVDEQSAYVSDGPAELSTQALKIPGSYDVALAIVPDEMMVSYERDPYVPVKRVLAGKGVPSQMVSCSTVKHFKRNPYVLFNLALNLYAKAGGMPWILDEDLSVEAVLGVSTAANGATSMWLCSWRQLMLKWDFEEKEGTGPKALYKLALRGLKELRSSLGKPMSSVALHKEGFYSSDELEVVKHAIGEALDEGVLREDCKWYVVSVRRNTPGRIVKSLSLTAAENPDKGTYLQLGKFSVMVCTVGFPERRITEYQSPVRPILVEVVEASNWDFDVKLLAKDVYWLSELHWASAFLSARLPVSVLYPSRLCSFWNAGLKPEEKLKQRLWFL